VVDAGSRNRYDAGPQSGGRPPAPGRLGLVQAFVNSHFDLVGDPGADRLETPEGLADWLEERELGGGGAVSRAEHARAVAVREGLRSVLAAHNGVAADPEAVAELGRVARALPAGFAVDAAGRTLPAPARPGVDGALGLVLALVNEAQAAGTWRRLKAGPGTNCGWASFDHSRNASSSWCSMRVCGSREKARAYRRRARDPGRAA